LRAGYSYFRLQAHRTGNGADTKDELAYEGSSPQNQFFLRSSIDLLAHLQFDTTLRYVDRLPGPQIPSYVTLDARLAWQARTDIEFAIVGQNLLQDHHAEFAPTFIGSQKTEIERSVYAKLTLRF
jgi:iron complex outermembrane receptor protein